MRLLKYLPVFSAAADLVACSPHHRSRAVPPYYLRDTQVTSHRLSQFDYYAQWAGSAYCNDDAQPGMLVDCTGEVCPDLEAHNASIVGSFSDKTFTSLEGFVGIDPVRSEIVVSFRGTDSIRNWITNLDFDTTNCDGLPMSDDVDCEVHSGWDDAWHQIRNSVYVSVSKAQTLYANYTLVVTGHSLGGAVATIAAAHLRADGYVCDLYTYGSPRVGNQGFVDFLDAQEGSEYRITHYDDPVPRVPPTWSWLGGYRHSSPEYWLNLDHWADVSPSAVNVTDFEICQGTENKDCNGGTDGLDIDAHGWYFRNISACDPGFQI